MTGNSLHNVPQIGDALIFSNQLIYDYVAIATDFIPRCKSDRENWQNEG